MKKVLLALSLALILAVSVAAYGASAIFATRDQVVYTEERFFGDPAALEGVTVNVRTTENYQLYWNSTFSPAHPELQHTEYEFFEVEAYDRFQTGKRELREYRGLSLFSYPSKALGYAEEHIHENPAPLAQAYRDLAKGMTPGQNASREILLKDYMEFYPLDYGMFAPDVDSFGTGVEGYEQYSEEYICAWLENYFRIPVLENEYCEISVNRTDGEYISGWGFGSANTGDRFAMGTMSAVTREAAYFFFDAHSDSGKLVDLSLLPDGFGVYRLPFTDIGLEGVTGSGRVVKCVDVHELEMICSLDPNMRLRDLTIDYQLEQLMVHSIEEETYYITFVDMATGAVLQKLPVMAAEEGVVSRYQFDDFWVLVNHFTNEVAVVTADGAGGHKVALLTGGMPEANDGAFLYPDIMAFDGQRLVMGSPEFGARWSGSGSDLYITAFDSTGLIYHGLWQSSLNYGLKNHSAVVSMEEWRTLSLE